MNEPIKTYTIILQNIKNENTENDKLINIKMIFSKFEKDSVINSSVMYKNNNFHYLPIKTFCKKKYVKIEIFDSDGLYYVKDNILSYDFRYLANISWSNKNVAYETSDEEINYINLYFNEKQGMYHPEIRISEFEDDKNLNTLNLEIEKTKQKLIELENKKKEIEHHYKKFVKTIEYYINCQIFF